MKKIKIYLLMCSFVISGFSCSDFLDVRPENQILLDDFWQKESDVEGVLLACYRAMQEDGFMYKALVWGELRSDNVVPSGSAGNDEKYIHEANILPNNGDCNWGEFYTVINYCNTVLKYAPGVMSKDPDFTLSDEQSKEAEALAIRALCYFYLVRTFRDIPWIVEATISDDQRLEVPQSKPEIILENITNDLLKAENWAMSLYPTVADTKGRMTKDAIRALLADVYLWRKDYAKCIEYCDKLIDAKATLGNRPVVGVGGRELAKYELIEEDASAEIFGMTNSPESIFELQFSTEKGNGAVDNFYGNSDAVGKMTATASYVEGTSVFSGTDDRKPDFIITTKTSGGEYKIFKYLGSRMGLGTSSVYSYSSTTANWIFYRITDIMLMKAEALVQLNRSENDLKSALHLVNTTYMRANPTLLATDTLAFSVYNSVASLEKLVLLERQRELMFEGKRWYDLVRMSERKGSTDDLVGYVLNKYTSNISTITSKLGVMNSLYLPINARELRVNPLLVQNPYYETSSSIEKN